MFLQLGSKPGTPPRGTSWASRTPLVDARLLLITAAVASLAYFTAAALADNAIYRHGRKNGFTQFMERIFPYPAAVINKDVIALSRFRKEIDAREAYAVKYQQSYSEPDLQRLVVNQLMNRTLYTQELKRRKLSVTEADVDKSLDDVYKRIGGQDKLTAFLHENYGDEISLQDFRQWIRESLAESAVENQILTRASVRHILIALPENPTEAQVETARKKAVDIKAKITSPDKFGDIAKQYSEDINSRDKNGDLGSTVRGSDKPVYSEEFENAIFNQEIGVVSDPVRSPFGWHLILVDKREGSVDKSLKAFTEELRQKGKVRAFIGL